MNTTYATIQLGGEHRNVERLGVMVAWLVSNNLLEPVLANSNSAAVTRVRLQDLPGPDFLTTVLHGELKAVHLDEEGQAFMDAYYVSGQFDEDYGTAQYEGDNEWQRYSEIAPLISAAYHRFKNPAPARQMAKILKFPGFRK